MRMMFHNPLHLPPVQRRKLLFYSVTPPDLPAAAPVFPQSASSCALPPTVLSPSPDPSSSCLPILPPRFHHRVPAPQIPQGLRSSPTAAVPGPDINTGTMSVTVGMQIFVGMQNFDSRDHCVQTVLENWPCLRELQYSHSESPSEPYSTPEQPLHFLLGT